MPGLSKSSRSALAILFLVNVLNFYDRQALGAVLEPLRHEFRLSDAQLGGLMTVFTVVYAFAGVPLGRLADTSNRKRLLAAGMATWSGLTALGGVATGYVTLLATRLGVGIGEAVCAPVAASWIGDLIPPARRARAMAGFMMAVPIGGMLSFAVTGRVAQAVGWRAALAFAALPVVILLPALLLLKEPARERAAQGEPAASPRMLLGIRAFWWIVASGAIVNFVLYSFSTFLPAFLTRVHGFSVADAGMWTGLGSGISGIAGAIAAGMLGDSRLGRQGNRRMALAAAAALAAAPPAFAAVLMPAGRASVAVPLLMLAYGLLQMYYGLVYAAIQDLVAPALRGTAMAVYFMAMYLCGASFGPLLTGGLSDYLAREALRTHQLTMEAARATGLQQAMFTMPALSVVLSAVLWAGARAMATRRPGSAARP